MTNPIPASMRLPLAVGLSALLLVGFLRFGGKLSNGIGNWIFHRQVAAKQQEVQKELDSAAEQKKALEQTLFELKQAKDDYAKLKQQSEAAEKLFYDQSKTSAEKVAEFKKALDTGPAHTPTDNITTNDLCTRAKTIGSSPATIAALCGQ